MSRCLIHWAKVLCRFPLSGPSGCETRDSTSFLLHACVCVCLSPLWPHRSWHHLPASFIFVFRWSVFYLHPPLALHYHSSFFTFTGLPGCCSTQLLPLSVLLYLFLPNTDISDLKSCIDSLVCQNLFSSATLLHTSLVCDTCPSVHSLPPRAFQSFVHFLYTCVARRLSFSDPISPSLLRLSLATLHREPPQHTQHTLKKGTQGFCSICPRLCQFHLGLRP